MSIEITYREKIKDQKSFSTAVLYPYVIKIHKESIQLSEIAFIELEKEVKKAREAQQDIEEIKSQLDRDKQVLLGLVE